MARSAQDDPSVLDSLRKRIAELEAARLQQTRAEDALRGTLFSPGFSFLDTLVTELARGAGADAASVGELLPGSNRVRTLSYFSDRRLAPGIEYALEGTPCENVVGKDLCVYPKDVARLFPRDAVLAETGMEAYAGAPLFDTKKRPIGLIFVLSRRPFADPASVERLLRIAAVRASAELERSRTEARLKTVLDSPMLGIVSWTLEAGGVEANDAFLNLLGYDAEDLKSGRIPWKKLTPPEYAPLDARALEDLKARGLSGPYEKEYFRKDGSRVPVIVSSTRVAADPLSGIDFILDLRQRKVAERSARDSDELNRQIVSSIKEGLIVHDRSLRYVRFNHEMELITGKTEAEVLGKHPLDVFPALREMGIYDSLERALRGETCISPDLQYRSHATGELRWTSTQSSPLRDSSGGIIGVLAVIRDVTPLKQVEGALRDSEARLGEALKHSEDRRVRLEARIQEGPPVGSMVGTSEAMQEVYRRLRLAAESDVTVLVTGESGTGKELAAKAIHDLSSRRTGPFVAVNCSAIPETLLESELFGHVKGSFTGATRDKAGLFQAAERGTLFLDEVGDMPAALQVKVLRALQEREIRRVGDDRAVKVDVRVVAATNRDLGEQIAQGKMREDFYYRIRVFEIRLPALRERREDIPLLVSHFIAAIGKRTKSAVRGLASDALAALKDHEWRGNIRELANVLEQAFVSAQGDHLRLSDLPPEFRDFPSEPDAPADGDGRDERTRIVEALEKAGGRKAEAARRLGISRVTLWKRMAKLGLDAGSPAE